MRHGSEALQILKASTRTRITGSSELSIKVFMLPSGCHSLVVRLGMAAIQSTSISPRSAEERRGAE
jgi:hypothetical protein